MKKALSLTAAIILWIAFIYTAIVSVFAHLIPHIISWKFDTKLVSFLVIDALILQVWAWLYKKLPHKPSIIAIRWMDKVSIL